MWDCFRKKPVPSLTEISKQTGAHWVTMRHWFGQFEEGDLKWFEGGLETFQHYPKQLHKPGWRGIIPLIQWLSVGEGPRGMPRPGNCLDNVCIESLFGHRKDRSEIIRNGKMIINRVEECNIWWLHLLVQRKTNKNVVERYESSWIQKESWVGIVKVKLFVSTP